jgi:hypothetical protein
MIPTVSSRAVLCLMMAISLVASSHAFSGGERGVGSRAALIAALEKLMTDGVPRHVDHDEGEWLQSAVNEAIRQGDAEIERLAIRAAAPVVARIVGPVRSINEPPSLEIDASVILKLPQTVRYVARVSASIDGSEYRVLWELRAGQRAGRKVFTGLPPYAMQPGYHHLRLKVHYTFGDPRAEGASSWSEERQLPDLAYALYDLKEVESAHAAVFLTSPTSTSAQRLDPTLPDIPFTTWLDRTFADLTRNPEHEWRVMYCAERTSELGVIPRSGDICSVMHFQNQSTVGQIWVRTGQISFTKAVPEWRQEPPMLEAITLLETGTSLDSLSRLESILQSDASTWPMGDVSIDPADIVVEPSTPQAGDTVHVSVNVKNQGLSDLHGVMLELGVATDFDRPLSRHFVIPIPKQSSKMVTLSVRLPAGYGFVFAHAMQLTEHSPFLSKMADDRDLDDAAYRVVNPKRAPAGYAASLAQACGCRGF